MVQPTMATPSRRTHSLSNRRLHLETARSPAATSTLELAALALDVGLLVLVGTEAEVLDGLTGVLGATEENGVGTGRGPQSNLVNGEGLTTSSLDAGTGRGGEAESSDGQRRLSSVTVPI
jgi:hypothetical protein